MAFRAPFPTAMMYNLAVPAEDPKREFKVGDKIRINLHHGKIEDAVVRAVVQDDDGLKLGSTMRPFLDIIFFKV